MGFSFYRWSKSTQTLEMGFGPCFRKGAYRTLEIAEHYRKKSEERSGLRLYIYECKICKKFHLTKQPQAEKGKKP